MKNENKGIEEEIKKLKEELEKLKKVELITLPKTVFTESILKLNDPVNWKVNLMNNLMATLQQNANEIKEDKKE